MNNVKNDVGAEGGTDAKTQNVEREKKADSLTNPLMEGTEKSEAMPDRQDEPATEVPSSASDTPEADGKINADENTRKTDPPPLPKPKPAKLDAGLKKNIIKKGKELQREIDGPPLEKYYDFGALIIQIPKNREVTKTKEEIAKQTGLSLDTINKAARFARNYDQESYRALMDDVKFTIPWRQVANNLSVDPDKFIEMAKGTADSGELNYALFQWKKDKAAKEMEAEEGTKQKKRPGRKPLTLKTFVEKRIPKLVDELSNRFGDDEHCKMVIDTLNSIQLSD